MQLNNFPYWLQGYLGAFTQSGLTPEQVKAISDKLEEVLKNPSPTYIPRSPLVPDIGKLPYTYSTC